MQAGSWVETITEPTDDLDLQADFLADFADDGLLRCLTWLGRGPLSASTDDAGHVRPIA